MDGSSGLDGQQLQLGSSLKNVQCLCPWRGHSVAPLGACKKFAGCGYCQMVSFTLGGCCVHPHWHSADVPCGDPLPLSLPLPTLHCPLYVVCKTDGLRGGACIDQLRLLRLLLSLHCWCCSFCGALSNMWKLLSVLLQLILGSIMMPIGNCCKDCRIARL
jgi:hypothetical protein